MRSDVRFDSARDPDFDELAAEVRDERFDAHQAQPPGSAEREKEATMSTLNERLDKVSKARRKKVEARAEVLIAEEMSLRDLRKTRKRTQVRLAKDPERLN